MDEYVIVWLYLFNFRGVKYLTRKKVIWHKHIWNPEDIKRKLTPLPTTFLFKGCTPAKLGREKKIGNPEDSTQKSKKENGPDGSCALGLASSPHSLEQEDRSSWKMSPG